MSNEKSHMITLTAPEIEQALRESISRRLRGDPKSMLLQEVKLDVEKDGTIFANVYFDLFFDR